MNGFDRSSGHEAEALELLFPDDYSPDEMDFAHEVHALFPIADEVLPPYYVQTMMDETFTAPVTPSDERTLISGVFARLRVAREPFLAKLPVLPSRASFVETIAQMSTFSRSVVTAAGMALAAMLFSVVLTGPAFAQGLWLLLGQTGVRQVSHYPFSIAPGALAEHEDVTAFSDLPIEWLGPAADGYNFSGVRLLGTATWSKGPIVDLQYSRTTTGRGSSFLDIREFTVADGYASVLQVVQAGSASYVDIRGMPAVYVSGTWAAQRDGPNPDDKVYVWQAGERSELIFQKGGVIYWVVGDQRDGVGQDQLIQIALDLAPIDQRSPQFGWLKRYGIAGIPRYQFRDLDGTEVYQLVPRGASPGNGAGALVASTSVNSHTH
jgi:hypothetical protein